MRWEEKGAEAVGPGDCSMGMKVHTDEPRSSAW